MLRRVFNKIDKTLAKVLKDSIDVPDVLGYGYRIPQETLPPSHRMVVCSLVLLAWGVRDHVGDGLIDVKCKEVVKNFDKHYQGQMQFEGY